MQLDGAGAPEETMTQDMGFVMNGLDTPEEQHKNTDVANARGKTVKKDRRRLRLVPLRLGSSGKKTREDDPEPPSPVDDATLRFLRSITAPGPGGKSLWEDYEDSVASPTFSAFPPRATRAELEGSAQDNSVDQQIGNTMPTTTTDESSESRSSLTSPSLSGEDATGRSSVSLSPPSVSATQKDEISSEEHMEEPPQSAE